MIPGRFLFDSQAIGPAIITVKPSGKRGISPAGVLKQNKGVQVLFNRVLPEAD